MPNEVDALFGQIDRHPFSGQSPDAVRGQENSVPLETAGPAQDLLLPPTIMDIITGGVPNGNFIEGPEDGVGTQLDDVDNKLPGWSYTTVQGSSMTVKWVADSAAPGGHAIEFEATDPSTDDEVYIEAILPVMNRHRLVVPTKVANRDNLPVVNTDIRLICQFLKVDLTTTGSEVTGGAHPSGTGEGIRRTWLTPPSDAAYLRVRARFKCLTGATGTDTYELRQVYAQTPQLHEVLIFGFEQDTPASTQTVLRFPHFSDVNAGSGKYIPDLPGFVMGTSLRVSGARTNGTLTAVVNEVVSGLDVSVTDAEAQIDGTDTERAYATRTLNTSAQDFDAGDELRLNVIANGSWAPTTADVVATARLMLFEE